MELLKLQAFNGFQFPNFIPTGIKKEKGKKIN
jgi:hypothetical protein